MTRHAVTGTRPFMMWAVVGLVLLLVVALVVGLVVIYPTISASKSAAKATAQTQAQLEQHYQAGVAFQNTEEWEAARGEYMQVIALRADYKDVQARLTEVKSKLAETVAAAETAAQATATAQAQIAAEVQANAAATAAAAPAATVQALESHYQRALGLINLQQWVEAQAELRTVFDAEPNYKDIQAQLALVSAEMARLTPTATSIPLTTAAPRATNTPAAMATSARLFFDDFEADAEGWLAIGRQAKVADGKYVLIGDSIVVAMAGSETWRDYSIRVKARVVSGKGDFGIVVRASEDCRLLSISV